MTMELPITILIYSHHFKIPTASRQAQSREERGQGIRQSAALDSLPATLSPITGLSSAYIQFNKTKLARLHHLAKYPFSSGNSLK